MNPIVRPIIAMALIAALGGCVATVTPPRVVVRAPEVAVGEVIVAQPPPPVRYEPVPPPPGPPRIFVWQPGHWRWERGAYVWHPGHYERRPRELAEWAPPVWVQRGGQWVFQPGHWVYR